MAQEEIRPQEKPEIVLPQTGASRSGEVSGVVSEVRGALQAPSRELPYGGRERTPSFNPLVTDEDFEAELAREQGIPPENSWDLPHQAPIGWLRS